MGKSKVLFISQEMTPYLPETEMSVIARNLPQGIQEKGKDIRIFMPRFGAISERRHQLHEVIRLSGMNLIISDTDHPLLIKVASIQSARMQVYFIDNEEFFQRKGTVTDCDGIHFSDNDERALFFGRGVLETIKKLRWAPDIIHCHGWFTCLAPLLIKKLMQDDPFFSRSKIVYSIYDDIFPDELDKKMKAKVKATGVGERDIKILESPTHLNLSKLAINMSDGVIKGCKEIDPELRKHIINSKKPFLEYGDDGEYINRINKFYDGL